MRTTLAARFDVIVVVWVLALAVSWCCYAVSHAQLTDAQWSSTTQSGPAWVVPGPGSGN